MPDFAYTVRDTPTVRARIQRDLSVVVRRVRAADPGLRSLVLTGGFARGEGAVRDGAPQNDYDFVAVRGWRPARERYDDVRRELESILGLHVDLSPIWAWRLPWARPTIFWYETALRGQVLWGENLLGRIPVQSYHDLDPMEALRLLVNRAAGLLLVTDQGDPHAHRLQAAKALLAAADAQLLAFDGFPPSQTERRGRLRELQRTHRLPQPMERWMPWIGWAYHYKVDPDGAPPRDAPNAWRAAAAAILDAVPVALNHAELPSLEAYARRDGLFDHLFYALRAARIPGTRPVALHPTGRVRVATLRLLEASLDGRVRPEDAREAFRPIARSGDHPLRLLASLRRATLQ